jgi:mannose-6-phosphate isomerase
MRSRAAVATQRRTTLVQARLTYVFSHAYLLSGDPVFREAARHGLAFLMRAARAPDGGWFRVVSVEGATLDNTRDATIHAFVLFALAWYCRASGDRAVIQLADATWDFMQQRLADPQHGGFFEEFRRAGPASSCRAGRTRTCICSKRARAACGDREKNWLRRAAALVDLFKRSFSIRRPAPS